MQHIDKTPFMSTLTWLMRIPSLKIFVGLKQQYPADKIGRIFITY